MKQFEIGKKYGTRSICDYDCIFSLTVLSRTEKTIKAKVDGFGVKTLRISTKYTNNESVKPLGSYSMSPTVEARELLS